MVDIDCIGHSKYLCLKIDYFIIKSNFPYTVLELLTFVKKSAYLKQVCVIPTSHIMLTILSNREQE
ncbi:MAG: hypothetical protein OHK0017_11960 [Patescibacteria group bacterium]